MDLNGSKKAWLGGGALSALLVLGYTDIRSELKDLNTTVNATSVMVAGLKASTDTVRGRRDIEIQEIKNRLDRIEYRK